MTDIRNRLNEKLNSLYESTQQLKRKMLVGCAGDAAKGIEGPYEVERLALAAMERIEADINAGKAKYKNINPYIRGPLRDGLKRALKAKLVDDDRVDQVNNFLKKIRN